MQLHAGQYAFTTIADSNDPQFSSFEYNGTPAVNNNGTVAFGATLVGGASGIFAGDGGALTTLVDTSGPFAEFYFEDVAINSSGTVAFRARLDSGEEGVFTVNDGTVTTIADSTGILLDFQGVSINEEGAVAFFCGGNDEVHDDHFNGVYVGQGGPLTTIVESHYSPFPPEEDEIYPLPYGPSINNHGDVAFFASTDDGNGIFVGNGDSLAQVVQEEGDWRRIRYFARCPINDAGMVAFVADGTSYGTRGVFRYADGAVTKIVDYNDVDPDDFGPHMHDFTDVMINNAGTVAFGGLWNANPAWMGIFTGADPEADKVVGVGDTVDGVVISTTQFWSRGFNVRGQVAFFAETESGPGIYLATPVPEPAASLLVVLGAGLLAWRRRAVRCSV